MEVMEQRFYDLPDIPRRHTAVDYDQTLLIEEFMVARPSNFDPEKTYGLIVFNSPSDVPFIPLDWGPVLVERDLLMVSTRNVGNDQPVNRRTGLAIAAGYAMLDEYNIDRDRVYVAGLSGGGRMASFVAFYHPELFRGAIMSVGADYLRPVPQVRAKPLDRDQGHRYGVMIGGDQVEVDEVKEKVRFVIVTGEQDFRYGHLHDIYHGGYLADGFQAKFLDVPGLGHLLAPQEAFAEAMEFIEQR